MAAAVAEQVLVEPREVARMLVARDVGGWGSVQDLDRDVTWEQSMDTEWHQVLMLSCSSPSVPQARLVAHVPSSVGAALESKAAASRAASDAGIGPLLLADFLADAPADGAVDAMPRRVLVSEYLPGGVLKADELADPDTMGRLGRLYGRLHSDGRMDGAWFDAPLQELLAQGALAVPRPPCGGAELGGSHGAAAAVPRCWASCLWVLQWLLTQVPASNRAALESHDVDWAFIAEEIAGLPFDPALPTEGVLGRTVAVHGDSHLGNVMRDGRGDLRLIDFDMTARGPAGSEFGFLTLMLFRCGFAPDMVVPPELQRRLVEGYLEELRASGCMEAAAASVDEVLLQIHCWGYTGLLKMGLLCAVLMENGGHEQKRQVMRARGPVLLKRSFLSAAKALAARALAGDAVARAELLSKGIFFATEASLGC